MELVITKDNGEIETFNAYRVQHSNSRGPYKGGLRYHPQVDLDDVRRYGPLAPLVPFLRQLLGGAWVGRTHGGASSRVRL